MHCRSSTPDFPPPLRAGQGKVLTQVLTQDPGVPMIGTVAGSNGHQPAEPARGSKGQRGAPEGAQKDRSQLPAIR